MPLDDLPESDLRPLKRLKQNEKRARKDNPEYVQLFYFYSIIDHPRIFPDSVKIVCESKWIQSVQFGNWQEKQPPRVFRERRQRIFIGFSKGKPAERNALCIEAITPGQWPA